jgi:hypothetical protein
MLIFILFRFQAHYVLREAIARMLQYQGEPLLNRAFFAQKFRAKSI